MIGAVLLACSAVQSSAAPAERPPLVNRVYVRVEEHLRERHRHPHTRQAVPVVVQDGENRVQFDHERFFHGRPQIRGDASAGPRVSLGVSPVELTLHVDPSAVPSAIVGDPRNDPPVTKPGFVSPEESGSLEGSGDTVLYGPELTVPLESDLSSWGPTGWMPRGTTLGVYGRARFGGVEVLGTRADLELYGIGPALGVPVLEAGGLRVAGVLAGGPAWFRSDLGDTTGVEASAGLRGETPLAGNLSVVAAAGWSLFRGGNVTTWGPSFNLGLSLGW